MGCRLSDIEIVTKNLFVFIVCLSHLSFITSDVQSESFLAVTKMRTGLEMGQNFCNSFIDLRHYLGAFSDYETKIILYIHFINHWLIIRKYLHKPVA